MAQGAISQNNKNNKMENEMKKLIGICLFLVGFMSMSMANDFRKVDYENGKVDIVQYQFEQVNEVEVLTILNPVAMEFVLNKYTIEKAADDMKRGTIIYKIPIVSLSLLVIDNRKLALIESYNLFQKINGFSIFFRKGIGLKKYNSNNIVFNFTSKLPPENNRA